MEQQLSQFCEPDDYCVNMTEQQHWTSVDSYIGQLLLAADAQLEAALQASAAAGLPRSHLRLAKTNDAKVGFDY
jgi:hypothetical protein